MRRVTYAARASRSAPLPNRAAYLLLCSLQVLMHGLTTFLISSGGRWSLTERSSRNGAKGNASGHTTADLSTIRGRRVDSLDRSVGKAVIVQDHYIYSLLGDCWPDKGWEARAAFSYRGSTQAKSATGTALPSSPTARRSPTARPEANRVIYWPLPGGAGRDLLVWVGAARMVYLIPLIGPSMVQPARIEPAAAQPRPTAQWLTDRHPRPCTARPRPRKKVPRQV
jgi:hypothetical protein